jgi:hypothetical protein
MIFRHVIAPNALDGEHAFALPTWGFVFEAGKKF